MLTPPEPDAREKLSIAREQDGAARTAWLEEVIVLEPATLVVLDETSMPTALTLGSGADRGSRPGRDDARVRADQRC